MESEVSKTIMTVIKTKNDPENIENTADGTSEIKWEHSELNTVEYIKLDVVVDFIYSHGCMCANVHDFH